MYKGQDSQLAVADETTEGTRPITVAKQPSGVVQDVEPGESKEKTEVRGQAGDRNYKEVVDTDQSLEPTVNILVQNLEILEYALGNVNEQTGDGLSPYDHAVTEATSLPTLSVEEKQVSQSAGFDLVRTWTGCILDSVEISSDEGGMLEATLDFIALDFTEGNTADSTSLLSDTPFKHADLNTVTFNTNSVPTDANAGPRSITQNIDNNTEQVPSEGSIAGALSEALNREYSVTISANPDDIQFYQDWDTNTNADLVITYERGIDDNITFTYSNAEIEEPGIPAPSEDLVEADIVFTAKSLKVTVTTSSIEYMIST